MSAARQVAARATGLVRRNLFLTLAATAALVTCVAVPPDGQYVHYLEVRTLLCLLSVLAVVSALDRLGVFTAAAERVVALLRSRRALVLGIVGLTLVGSMLFTNDMALIAFLPLSLVALRRTGNEDQVALVFVLQTVAANLGGMLTPFGSPQNLFLFQYYDLTVRELVSVMAIPFALSVALIALACLLVPDGAIEPVDEHTPVRWSPTVVHLTLFVVVVAMVVRVVPVWTAGVVLVVVALLDARALLRIDYGLLLTFVAFFVFAGNLERLPVVESALTDLLHERVLLWSALTSQLISNVPTAVLFAPFTDDHRQLLVGVNVGGVGTVVASLASLITLRRLERALPGQVRRFLVLFTVVNTTLLLVLTIVCWTLFATGVL